MAAVHKKHEPSSAKASTDAKAMADKPEGQGEKAEEKKTEPVVVSDVVTQTTERIEVIEEVTPEPKSETEASAETRSEESSDPLTDFKEKMIEEEESPVSDMGSQKNFMWPILFVFIFALLLLGGIFIYKQSANKTKEINVVTLSPTPTAIPAPTKAVDLAKYEIKILNGSEVSGEAGRQQSNLEEEGFTVASVGNADDSNFTETIIQAKENVEQAFLDKLKNVLGKSFVVGEMEELPEDSDSDVIVILGSETN
jgi:hypothetical protein